MREKAAKNKSSLLPFFELLVCKEVITSKMVRGKGLKRRAEVLETEEDATSTEDDATSSINHEISEVPEKVTYKTFFRYEYNKKGEKIGVCSLCEQKKIHREFRMTNGSTNGIRGHLQREHKESAAKLFGEKCGSDSQWKNGTFNRNGSSGERIDTFLKVSSLISCFYTRII